MSSQRLVRWRKTACRLAGAGLTAAVLAALAAPAWASGPDGKAYCADVIQTNTKVGLMKNKHVVAFDPFTDPRFRKLITQGVAIRARFLAETPNAIKGPVTHEVDYFTRLKANNFAATTPTGSFTFADGKAITIWERVHCGIIRP